LKPKWVGLKFSKCLNQTSLICIFKAFGVILLHFKVEKWIGVILQKKNKKLRVKNFLSRWCPLGYRNHTYFFIWPKEPSIVISIFKEYVETLHTLKRVLWVLFWGWEDGDPIYICMLFKKIYRFQHFWRYQYSFCGVGLMQQYSLYAIRKCYRSRWSL
jgi:hypothetical protein